MSDRLDSALDALAREPVEVSWGDVEDRLGWPSPRADAEVDLDLDPAAERTLGGSGLHGRLPLLAVASLLVLLGLVVLVPALQDEPDLSPTESGSPTSAADPPNPIEPRPPAVATRPLLPPVREVALPALPLLLFAAVATVAALRHRRATHRATGSPRRSRAGWLGGLFVLAVVASAWLWQATAPSEVHPPSAGMTFAATAPGESYYIGYVALSERDLVIDSAQPVTLNDLSAAVWMCEPRPGVGMIGSVPEDDLAGYCQRFEPFVPGSVIRGRKPNQPQVGPYLVVEITATSSDAQALCGLDITYRLVDGWRSGRAREAGSYRVVVNEDIGADRPDEQLIAQCATWN